MDFPRGSDRKEFACNAVDLDSIAGLERSPGEENGYPLQYSCLENPMNSMKRQNDRPGVGDGQGGLACCDSWGRKELDTPEAAEHPLQCVK